MTATQFITPVLANLIRQKADCLAYARHCLDDRRLSGKEHRDVVEALREAEADLVDAITEAVPGPPDHSAFGLKFSGNRAACIDGQMFIVVMPDDDVSDWAIPRVVVVAMAAVGNAPG